jgi:hypothetical protein
MRALGAVLLFLLPSSLSAAKLDGRVVAAHTGAPLASVLVQVHKVGQQPLAAELETDLQGLFQADGLPDGDYRVEFSKPNFLASALPVRLAAGAPGLYVRMVRLGVITGRVTDRAGQPVTRALVFAMPKPAPGRPFQRKMETGHYSPVDGQGQYRLHSLPPGEYAIAVSYGASTTAVGSSGSAATDPKYGSGHQFFPDNARPRFLNVGGGEEHRNIDIPVVPAALHTVSGKVEQPEPKKRFLVGFASLDQPAFATAVAATSEDGTFKIAGVPPGAYHLFAAGPSGARNSTGYLLQEDAWYARRRIDLSGEDITNLMIAPEKGQTVNFLLRVTGSGCPSTATLAIEPLEDWGSSRQLPGVSVTTEKPVQVHGLGPTKFAVNVTTAGSVCHGVEDAVLDLTSGPPPDPVTITVAPAGSIRGRLDTGNRAPSGFVVMVMPSDPMRATYPARTAIPDAMARFAIDGLRPGKYRIAAMPAGTASQRDMARMFEIDVFGGSALEVDLAVPPTENQP